MKIKKGFIDCYGCKWSQAQCDKYNRVSAEIERLKIADTAEAIRVKRTLYNLPIYKETQPIIDSQLSGVRIA